MLKSHFPLRFTLKGVITKWVKGRQSLNACLGTIREEPTAVCGCLTWLQKKPSKHTSSSSYKCNIDKQQIHKSHTQKRSGTYKWQSWRVTQCLSFKSLIRCEKAKGDSQRPSPHTCTGLSQRRGKRTAQHVILKFNYTKRIQTHFFGQLWACYRERKGFSLTGSAHDTKEEHGIDNPTETGL